MDELWSHLPAPGRPPQLTHHMHLLPCCCWRGGMLNSGDEELSTLTVCCHVVNVSSDQGHISCYLSLLGSFLSTLCYLLLWFRHQEWPTLDWKGYQVWPWTCASIREGASCVRSYSRLHLFPGTEPFHVFGWDNQRVLWQKFYDRTSSP